MTTYYVTADHRIIISPFNPPQGWILAEFPVEEDPNDPFNPFTVISDGRIERQQLRHKMAEQKAEKFLEDLIASGHLPVDISDLTHQ